jgi:hypothetical protein
VDRLAPASRPRWRELFYPRLFWFRCLLEGIYIHEPSSIGPVARVRVDKLAGAWLTISLLSLGVTLLMGILMPPGLVAELCDRLARFVLDLDEASRPNAAQRHGAVALARSHVRYENEFAEIADCLMRSRPWWQPVSPSKILYIRARS